jgi:hypothetical protein
MSSTNERTDEVLKDWRDAVNMTARELEQWLDSPESKSVGDTGGEGESTGHKEGRRIVQLLGTKKGDLSDDDVAQMRRVVGYVHRHLAQGGPKDDVEHSKWRYSLMNWGHDPLKR